MNIAHILDRIGEIERHFVRVIENLEMIVQLNAKLDESIQVLKDIKEVIEAIYGENKRVS